MAFMYQNLTLPFNKLRGDEHRQFVFEPQALYLWYILYISLLVSWYIQMYRYIVESLIVKK